METLLNGFSLYLNNVSILAFPIAYIGGLLVSFSPCVYPVAPITIAYIGAHSAGSKWKGFWLSLIFVLGMACTYTFLGAFVALSGNIFGQIQNNPWTYFVMANICLLMGMSLLGTFQLALKMPAFLSGLQGQEKPGGVLGSFMVGALSGLVVGPCTAPVLAVLLSYVAMRQNVIFGMSLLFVFSLGKGTLLVLLGTFAGLVSSLPKSGLWMIRINRLFGFILLAVAEYFFVNAGMLFV